MKIFIVLALFFTVNSFFLRNLDAHALSNIKFGAECYDLSDEATTSLTATATSDKGTAGAVTFKATFTSGENKIEAASGNLDEANSVKTITWTAALTSAKTGVYKLTSVEDTTANSGNTFTLPEKNDASCVVTVAAELGTQTSTETQEIKEGDETKGSFTVVFKAALDDAPVVFTATDGKTPIADCKVDTTTKTNLVCKPTQDEMKDGEEYTIHYQNGCGASPAGITSTGVKVKFVAEEASAFMKLGKLVMIAVTLLF